MDKQNHWETVYRTKSDREVSWYTEHLQESLKLIIGTGEGRSAAIIDVGGGSSTLVDDLIESGFSDLTVLDISASALGRSQERLGPKAQLVDWVTADITKADLPARKFDVWHDRAVFHFLTDAEDRRRYVDLVQRSVKPGGHVIVAAFGPNGPLKCSGLDTVRYTAGSMHDEFGSNFELVDSVVEVHETPFGTTQEFVYCYCRLAENDEERRRHMGNEGTQLRSDIYGISRELDIPFGDAVERLKAALSSEGFGVLTEIDLKAKFKQKLDKDFEDYIILGACNPDFAYRALGIEMDLGLLLPCNAVVYQRNERTVVALIDAKKMLNVTNNNELSKMASEVDERLRRALTNL